MQVPSDEMNSVENHDTASDEVTHSPSPTRSSELCMRIYPTELYTMVIRDEDLACCIMIAEDAEQQQGH